ncbi:MAG: hypothetical protein EA376_11925 [Phycisphaeraceae bacterium]|nr:MAG: hypothetical protein EA376_11925 [Phycisphaeraceae bacterium]
MTRAETSSVENGSKTLCACILLAGGLRPSELTAAVGRSVLNLYLTQDRTTLGLWLDRLEGLRAPGCEPPPARVIYDESAPAPTRAGVGSTDRVSIEKEKRQYRGPAGALRDACETYAEADVILVADAARCLLGDLRPMLNDHLQRGADVTVASNQDGTPAGLYLVRCGALALAPKSGFMDFKEQFLSKAMREGMTILAHRLGERSSLPLRTRGQFLAASARLAGVAAPDAGGIVVRGDEALEIGEGGLRVVSPEAEVAEDAVVAESVVMPGALVGAGAVVARSIVCPGARVEAGAHVVDAVVSESGVRLDGGASFSDRKGRR